VSGFGGARFNMGLQLCRYDPRGHWFWCYDYFVGDPWNEFDGFTGDANWVVAYSGAGSGRHVPALAWEGIREAYDDIRHAATLEKLLAERAGAARNRIAAQYERLRADLPQGRDFGAFPPDPDGPYAELPSYYKLSVAREAGSLDRTTRANAVTEARGTGSGDGITGE